MTREYTTEASNREQTVDRRVVEEAALDTPACEKDDHAESARSEESRLGKCQIKDSSSARQAMDIQLPDIYSRFSRRRKLAILGIVTYNGFMSPMTAAIFLPSIPSIAADLKTTQNLINVSVAIFIISMGTMPLIWSPLSGFYGRRPIYLASVPIMLVATIGVAFSSTLPQLIATRILQGIGSSSSLAVGAGSIGDIYGPTERSNAMGWFYSGILLGPSLAPIIGAAFTEYTQSGWRGAQYFVAGTAVLSIALTYFFLPETLHHPTPHSAVCAQRGKRFVPFSFNPLSILGLFRWPNICSITFISSACMLETYVVIVPLTSAFGDQYGITNVLIIGCLYLGNGAGNVIGARIAGPMADATVRRYICRRGYRRPEDRLRAAVLGVGFVMPLSCMAYGWLIETSTGGLAPPVVFLVLQAIGLMLLFTPVNTYAVDCMQSSEVIAVNNWIRYLCAAGGSAFVLPMSKTIGWGWTMTVAAILLWIATSFLLLTITYGHIWRERANERYGYVVLSEDEKHTPSSPEFMAGRKANDAEEGLDQCCETTPHLAPRLPPPRPRQQLTQDPPPGNLLTMQTIRTTKSTGASVHRGV